MMMTGIRIAKEVVRFIVIQIRSIFQLMDDGSLLYFRNMKILNQNPAGPNS